MLRINMTMGKTCTCDNTVDKIKTSRSDLDASDQYISVQDLMTGVDGRLKLQAGNIHTSFDYFVHLFYTPAVFNIQFLGSHYCQSDSRVVMSLH